MSKCHQPLIGHWNDIMNIVNLKEKAVVDNQGIINI
jgi:hypothetical protein